MLGSLLESSLRRSLLMFDGSAAGFFTRPISATLLVVFVVVAVLPLIRAVRDRRAGAVPAGGAAVADGSSDDASAKNREEESV